MLLHVAHKEVAVPRSKCGAERGRVRPEATDLQEVLDHVPFTEICHVEIKMLMTCAGSNKLKFQRRLRFQLAKEQSQSKKQYYEIILR